jgi:hypothetical protein
MTAHAGLIGLYTFNGDLTDSSGSGNNGTNAGSNNVTFSANGGPSGGPAGVFNGNAWFNVPIDTRTSALSQVTYGGWFDLTDASTIIRGLISNDDGNFDRTLDIDTRNSGLKYSVFNGAGVQGGTAVSTSTWVFLAVSYNQTTNSLVFDSNGTQVSGSTSFGSQTVTNTTIGRNPNFDTPFVGQMSSVFVYNTALDFTQLEQIRSGGPSFFSPSNPTPGVPEPGTMALLGTGLIGVAMAARRRVKR